MSLDLFQSPQIQLPSKRAWFWTRCLDLVPRELEDVITWADTHYRVINNDSEFFKSADSPWLIEPLQMADDPLIASLTFVKPIQTGGTSLGEIILLRRAMDSNGQLSYLWPTNDKAKDRWEKWTEKRIRACRPVRALMPYEYENMLIKFKTGLTFAMQGVFTSGNLDSDTVGIIINEEVHQWQPGMLAKAKGRQTRVDFPKFITISNSGEAGGELHTDFNNGTQQHFENYCPGCGKYHIMRTRWEDARPDLGGLRYDSEGCKRADGTFDYNKLVPTIRYQMACGYELRDNIGLRRESATRGRYSAPFNTGALHSQRSYTYQAVACHNIRWLDLIQEKHNALRSLKAGKDDAWRQYLQERESVFYDKNEHKPYDGAVIYNTALTKNREGMKDAIYRAAKFDRQRGYKHLGELEHYWGQIWDVDAEANSQLVWEGKVDSDAELLAECDAHQVPRINTWIDVTGTEMKRLLQFCYQNGMNAINLSNSRLNGFLHPDRTRRFYSLGKPIHKELNVDPIYPYEFGERQNNGDVFLVPNPEEPLVVELHKAGMLANMFFIRDMRANVLKENPNATEADYIRLEIPSDVSQVFRDQLESWEIVPGHRGNAKDQSVDGFKPRTNKDHQLMNLAYHCFELEWKQLPGENISLLGARLSKLGLAPITETQEK